MSYKLTLFKIFVGNLSSSVTPIHLYERFKRFGTVVQFDTIGDHAHVYMINENEAQAATNHLNGEWLDGQQLIVNSPLTTNWPESLKVFLGNLPEGVTPYELIQICSTHGEVVRCDIINNFSFIYAADETTKRNIIRSLNGTLINGKFIIVDECTRDKSHNLRHLYVGNLPTFFRRKELYELFSRFGNVEYCNIKGHQAFVRMSDKNHAKRAIELLNGQIIKGNEIKVATSTSNKCHKIKMYVSNFPAFIRKEDLRNLFSQYTRVFGCDIIKRCYAFVLIDSADAVLCIEKLYGQELYGQYIKVAVAENQDTPLHHYRCLQARRTESAINQNQQYSSPICNRSMQRGELETLSGPVGSIPAQMATRNQHYPQTQMNSQLESLAFPNDSRPAQMARPTPHSSQTYEDEERDWLSEWLNKFTDREEDS